MTTHFTETQRFNQVWAWLLLIAIQIIPVWGIYQQMIKGVPFGNNPAPNWVLVLFLLFTLSVLGFFLIIRLTTSIDEEGITIKFSPFTKKRILWNEIETAEVLNYGFVGGWGIRFGTRYGTVYNTSGNIGLALLLKNGSKFCVGTQEEEALQKTLEHMQIIH